MEEANALFVVAEVSVGLAGFTGVVAAFQGRGGWHPFDILRVVSLLWISFSALFVALLPIGLHAAGISESSVWRISSGLGIAFVAVGYIVTTRYTPPGLPDQQRMYGALLLLLGGILLLLYVLTIVLAVFWPFFFALFTILAVAALQFANVLIVRPT